MNVSSPEDFTISHTYKQGGYFAVLVNVTDSAGVKSVLQLVAIVRGKGTTTFANTCTANCSASGQSSLWEFFKDTSKMLVLAWPTYLIVILMLCSFWLGEREQLYHHFHKRARRSH